MWAPRLLVGMSHRGHRSCPGCIACRQVGLSEVSREAWPGRTTVLVPWALGAPVSGAPGSRGWLNLHSWLPAPITVPLLPGMVRDSPLSWDTGTVLGAPGFLSLTLAE